MEDGLRLFLKERNNMIAGRKVELIVGDTGGQPAITKTKARELAEKTGCSHHRPVAAFEALAIDDYIRKSEIPGSCPAAAEDLTQRSPTRGSCAPSGPRARPATCSATTRVKELKHKRVAIIADDFAFGHETAALQRTFEENGGKVVQKLWSPLNVADYSTYIGQIAQRGRFVFAASPRQRIKSLPVQRASFERQDSGARCNRPPWISAS
jgi:branched-chain amino acid transport system substrate-binding protein